MKKITKCLASLGLVATFLVGVVLQDPLPAQSYPARPVKLIVPYPSGGGTDIAARWIAQKLRAKLNQTFFVDNRAGGNGNVGTNIIAKSPPDGYVIGMATPGPVTVGRSLYPGLPYNPKADLAPIILANESPIVLIVNPSVPAKSLRELVALAKARPGKLTAALVSRGSVPHLLTELLKISAHINILDVPYKGGAPATIDTMGGEVDMLFSVLPLVLPNIKTGQLRPIAIASAVRSPLIPDVPTTVEQGYADVIGSAWNGVVAPANTPREIVDMLNGEISQILSAADTAQRFNALGMEAMGGTSQSFAQFLQAESDKWAKVIATAHVQAEQ